MNIDKILRDVDSSDEKVRLVFAVRRAPKDNRFACGICIDEFINMYPMLEDAIRPYDNKNFFLDKFAVDGDFDGRTLSKLKGIEELSDFVTWIA